MLSRNAVFWIVDSFLCSLVRFPLASLSTEKLMDSSKEICATDYGQNERAEEEALSFPK